MKIGIARLSLSNPKVPAMLNKDNIEKCLQLLSHEVFKYRHKH